MPPEEQTPTVLDLLSVPPKNVRKRESDSFDEVNGWLNLILGKIASLASEVQRIEDKIDAQSVALPATPSEPKKTKK